MISNINIKYTKRSYVICNVTLRCFRATVVCNGIFICIGPKRDEVTGEWRKLHNEELSDLYSLCNIVRVVKSRRMRRGGACGAYGGGERCAQGSGWET